MTQQASTLSQLIQKYPDELQADWLREQTSASTFRKDLMSETELRRQSSDFFKVFATAIRSGQLTNVEGEAWKEVRQTLADVSRSRALQGFSPSETAMFILSLKQPLFARIRSEYEASPNQIAHEMWVTTVIIDKLALHTTELYQKGREELINRQQSEMLELSTPVVQLWDGILALPMIGTLDSGRTQVVMETLLHRIVETGSEVAIIDITGVPTVDTLVAQHLLKTVTAARLMGAECIISGIRPQIAATIVHLGVELGNIATKSSLADAFKLALQKTGQSLNGSRGNGAASTSRSASPASQRPSL